MKPRKWDEVSLVFMKFCEQINELVDSDLAVILIVQDPKDNIAGVLHSCSPHLAEAIIHDAFDKYDASEVQEVLNDQETKPRS